MHPPLPPSPDDLLRAALLLQAKMYVVAAQAPDIRQAARRWVRRLRAVKVISRRRRRSAG